MSGKDHTKRGVVVEMDAGGVSMRNIGGGPVMFFSPQAWIDHISEIKAGKYDFPQKEKVPE